jgi:hypothetical protein
MERSIPRKREGQFSHYSYYLFSLMFILNVSSVGGNNCSWGSSLSRFVVLARVFWDAWLA